MPLCYCYSTRAKPTISFQAQTSGRNIIPEDRTGSGSAPVIPVKKKPVHPLQLVLPELVAVLVLPRLLKFLPGVGGRSLLGKESREHKTQRMTLQGQNVQRDTGQGWGRW